MKAKVLGILALLFVLCLFMAVTSSDPWYKLTSGTFLQPNNVENLLRRTSLYGILGIGVAFVIITGGIDLSIGSVVCLSGCLLAIFLDVSYRPFDNQTVLEVRAEKQQVVVAGGAPGFEVGDRIRYFGGRRARPTVATIGRIKRAEGVTLIQVDKPFTRDDDAGQIAKVIDVVSFRHRDLTTSPTYDAAVTLAGRLDHLARRDQVMLIHPESGLNQQVIRGVEVDGQATKLTFDQDLGSNFNDNWVAVPLERRQRMPILMALGSVLAVALGLGLLHGLLVTRMKLQPFVVTLCGLLFYRGISRWLVNDQPVGFGNEYVTTLSPLGRGKLVLAQWENLGHTETFGLPYPFFILLLCAFVAGVFLNKTIWGRYLLALGRNEEAARYSGINTGRITLLAYIISTVLAATGGILFALDSNQVPPSSFGNFFELYAIAAAVLGGCSLRGGEGAVIGVVILGGVTADELVKRWVAKRRLGRGDSRGSGP